MCPSIYLSLCIFLSSFFLLSLLFFYISLFSFFFLPVYLYLLLFSFLFSLSLYFFVFISLRMTCIHSYCFRFVPVELSRLTTFLPLLSLSLSVSTLSFTRQFNFSSIVSYLSAVASVYTHWSLYLRERCSQLSGNFPTIRVLHPFQNEMRKSFSCCISNFRHH